MKKKSLRELIQFYLIDCKTIPGKIIDITILLLNLLICATFVIETYAISANLRQILWQIELVVVFFFVIEYFARLYGSRNRGKHVLRIYSIIDLIAILPTIILVFFPGANVGFVKVIRVLRVLRVFRFLRFIADPEFFFGKITYSLLKVLRLLLTILIIFFISSGFFWTAEHVVNPGINNFGDAFYFTVVALTTVGFGDITPASDAGRLVVVLMIISGIILIPWQASQIMREWFRISDRRRVTCKKCGLRYHDRDAVHCKHCGKIIYQEVNGTR